MACAIRPATAGRVRCETRPASVWYRGGPLSFGGLSLWLAVSAGLASAASGAAAGDAAAGDAIRGDPAGCRASSWCVHRRFAGDTAGGEFGFRFGVPLDLDADGVVDPAAGSRFREDDRHYQNGRLSLRSGADGRSLLTVDGPWQDALYGHAVLMPGDLDGDGTPDVVTSAPNAREGDRVRGRLEARSPARKTVLWSIAGAPDENFGWDLDAVGDVDGDGRADLLVGAPAPAAGRAYVVSGATGGILRTLAPADDQPTFGWYVAAVGDVDGDGHRDLAVGAPWEDGVGAAHVFSGADGRRLRHWKGPDARSNFSEIVADAGDVDGDGRGDVAVGAARTNDTSRSAPGDVYVISGSDGRTLQHFQGRQPAELYGRMVAGIGDIDGDGVVDLAIGAPWYGDGARSRLGRLELRSGRGGELLAELVGERADGWFGWHVVAAPDPTGKGRPAMLVGSIRYPVEGQAGTGVIDWLVGPTSATLTSALQGTISREPRRSDMR